MIFDQKNRSPTTATAKPTAMKLRDLWSSPKTAPDDTPSSSSSMMMKQQQQNDAKARGVSSSSSRHQRHAKNVSPQQHYYDIDLPPLAESCCIDQHEQPTNFIMMPAANRNYHIFEHV
eukprot:CAMPEP_0119569466 /NCGR_PEP_ID=MMETSP1352-20130426/41695_1 /TAXON_ID=265584 /ORGANISM="Stauroneis constricta, Strain CCMP1120" /LENGTH=117 /DNA_ID=CAMNT_0007619017 /DNA_START=14 /DNA_END=363 /DNA_ORIENTATION=-